MAVADHRRSQITAGETGIAQGRSLDYDRRVPQRAPALFAAMATIFCGCGYTSTYVPPDGWRARPLYNGNEVVMVGSTELPECATDDEEEYGEEGLPPRMMLDDDGYWVPAPRVHVVFWGPVFHPHPFFFHPPGPHNLLLGALFKGSGGVSSGGNGKGAGMVFAFAAAVAVVASSGVAIGLAADPPEDDDVAEGIDQVNRHNDLVRERIAECIRLAEARRASPPTAPAEPAPAAIRQEPEVVLEVKAAAPAPTPAPAQASPSLRPADPNAPSLRAAPARTAVDEGDPASSATSPGSGASSGSDEEVPW